jgi:hypothetical protein
MWLGILEISVVFLAVIEQPWHGRANPSPLNEADASQVITQYRSDDVIGHSRTSRGGDALEANLQVVRFCTLPATAYEPQVLCRNQTVLFGCRLLNEHAGTEVSVAVIRLSVAGVIMTPHLEHSKCWLNALPTKDVSKRD